MEGNPAFFLCHDAVQGQGGGIESVCPFIEFPPGALEIVWIGDRPVLAPVSAGDKRSPGFLQRTDCRKTEIQHQDGKQKLHEHRCVLIGKQHREAGKKSGISEQRKEDQQNIFRRLYQHMHHRKAEKEAVRRDKDKIVSGSLHDAGKQNDQIVGQIDLVAPVPRDDLIAQNAVMVFRPCKIGAVEGKADAKPDRRIKKIGIGVEGFADMVHTADETLPCKPEDIGCPQSDDALDQPEKFVFQQSGGISG